MLTFLDFNRLLDVLEHSSKGGLKGRKSDRLWDYIRNTCSSAPWSVWVDLKTGYLDTLLFKLNKFSDSNTINLYQCYLLLMSLRYTEGSDLVFSVMSKVDLTEREEGGRREETGLVGIFIPIGFWWYDLFGAPS